MVVDEPPESELPDPGLAQAGGSRRQWPLRIVGSLFGIGGCLVGLFALLGAQGQPELNRERAIGFGIAALVIGAVALSGSLASRDVHALWYCSPRRWRLFRDDL
jgi:hypothetical protein